jgi:hypothetical protein
MPTKIKDQATATQAALSLNKAVEVSATGEPITPADKSTSEKLFPEFVTDDGGIINRPVKAYEDKAKALPVSETPLTSPQDQKPPTAAPTAPTYLKVEELAGKMVKLKVDGIEQDVPAESLIKTTQLERSLNARLMELASERKRLEDERADMQRKMTAPIPEPPKKQDPQNKKSAEVEALEARLAQMEGFLAQQQETLRPAIQEAGIKRVDKMVKERIGADDFPSYFDRVKQSALEEMSKPENINNPQARQFLDSDAFYFNKYQELKLRDVLSNPPRPQVQGNVPALVTQSGAPVVVTNQGRPVSIPNMESSGGVPSRVNNEGESSARAQVLFDAARREGTTEAWLAYYRAAKL